MPVTQRRRFSVSHTEETTTTTETTSTFTTSPGGSNTLLAQESWSLTVHFKDIPDWLQDNHYILTGYRPASESFARSAHSLTYIHNETVNIFSHLLPALLIIPFSIFFHHTIPPRYETATTADIVAFSCFFAGSGICFGLSALYHTISNHSPLVAYIGNACDYVGIVGLITGSFIPSIYYGFYCTPQFQRFHWGMIALLGTICAVISTVPRFRTPSLRTFRAAMFVALGLSAVVPVGHGVVVFGFDQLRKQIGLDWLLLQGFLYILGATIYASRFPERLYPGRFDILGSSHQIFHLLVVLAASAHMKGLLNAFDYWHAGPALTC
ncbi:hypothetical protein FQN57_000075 [Myotisia sp. PD_48]|nr:hypothetical protein FQN57_000075 [Myotisia sp. PD_48]